MLMVSFLVTSGVDTTRLRPAAKPAAAPYRLRPDPIFNFEARPRRSASRGRAAGERLIRHETRDRAGPTRLVSEASGGFGGMANGVFSDPDWPPLVSTNRPTIERSDSGYRRTRMVPSRLRSSHDLGSINRRVPAGRRACGTVAAISIGYSTSRAPCLPAGTHRLMVPRS